MNELERRAKKIFMSALDDPPADRALTIENACGNDGRLRAEVRALFDAYEHSTQFLATPAMETNRAPARRDSEWIGRRIGAFTIRSVLASGGMGVVYLADQEKPRRTVALKMLRSAMPSDSAIRRFEYEAEVLGRLQHPNVAQIFEAGMCDPGGSGAGGTPYFALEFIEGSVDLIEHCTACNLGLAERLDLFGKVCRAVHYAHQQGIIHRDLKPHNILVEQAHGEPKIIDFGIARAAEADLSAAQTADGQVLGTLQYSSPEQCGGGRATIDIRTDVYALGVMLYEMLAGQPPFDFSDMGMSQVLRTVQEVEPQRLGAIDPSLRGDVETIVHKAMAKECERRYESAAAVADDLARFLHHEPIAARAPSTMYQLKKFSQRNRALVGGFAASVMILIAGMVAVSFALAAEGKQRRLAEQATTAANFERLQAVTARDAESEQRERAGELAEAADAHAALIARVLMSSNPWVSGRGADEGMIQTLELAATELDTTWSGPPLNEAALRLAVGQTYQGFGRASEVERHGKRALDIFSEQLGDNHEYTIRTLMLLASAADSQGRFTDGRALLDRALAASEATVGLHAETEVVLFNGLCRAAIRTGAFEEAEGFARRAVERSDDTDASAQHRNSAVLGLADALSQQRRFDEAEPHYHTVLERRRRDIGPDHPSTLVVEHNLAGLLIRSGRAGEALPLLQHVLETRQDVLGDGHSMTLIAMNDLAHAHIGVGDIESARKLAEAAMPLFERHLGPAHPHTFTMRSTLALALNRLGMYERCAEVLRETIDVATEQQGPESTQTLLLKHNLGVIYHRLKQYDEALELLEDVRSARGRTLGENSAWTRASQLELAGVYLDLGDTTGARDQIDGLLASESVANDFNWFAGMLRVTDARCLAFEGAHNAAEERFHEAIDLIESAVGRAHYRSQIAIQHAINFCVDTGRDDVASRLRGRLNEPPPDA